MAVMFVKDTYFSVSRTIWYVSIDRSMVLINTCELNNVYRNLRHLNV